MVSPYNPRDPDFLQPTFAPSSWAHPLGTEADAVVQRRVDCLADNRVRVAVQPGGVFAQEVDILVAVDIVQTLLPLASHLVISAPDMTREQSDILAYKGARMSSKHLPLRETLAASRLVIHFGGGGLAAHSVAAGVPQLIFAMHIEQLLNGLQIENAGLGKVVDSFLPKIDVAQSLENALADESVRQQAAFAGRAHREMLKTMKPLDTFEATALKLLGL